MFRQRIRRVKHVEVGVGELSVFCQSYFNKTLIGQPGSIGRKARQEVEVEQRDRSILESRKLPPQFCPDHRRGKM